LVFATLDCASSTVATGAVADVAVAGVLIAAGVAVALADVADVGATVAAVVLAPPLGGNVEVVVEPELDVPEDVLDVPEDDVLDASGLCACLAVPAAPRAVFVALEPSELTRSRPGVAWLPLPLPCACPDAP
jgi:hypothetical protein